MLDARAAHRRLAVVRSRRSGGPLHGLQSAPATQVTDSPCRYAALPPPLASTVGAAVGTGRRYHRHGRRCHRHGRRCHRHGRRCHRHGRRCHRHGRRYHRHGRRCHRHGRRCHRHGRRCRWHRGIGAVGATRLAVGTGRSALPPARSALPPARRRCHRHGGATTGIALPAVCHRHGRRCHRHGRRCHRHGRRCHRHGRRCHRHGAYRRGYRLGTVGAATVHGRGCRRWHGRRCHRHGRRCRRWHVARCHRARVAAAAARSARPPPSGPPARSAPAVLPAWSSVVPGVVVPVVDPFAPSKRARFASTIVPAASLPAGTSL